MKTKSVIISVLAILFSTVCGINTTYAGPTAAITLTASRLSVPADGVSSIAITADLCDNANFPVDIGTKATFTTTLGTFRDPTTFILQKAITETVTVANQVGPCSIIVVSLMSEKISGIAMISCTSNGVTQYVTVSFDATGSIKLTAIPPWIPSDGKSSSGIKATVINTGGAAVAVGTPVTFTTTKGLLSDGKGSPAKTITVQVSNAEGTVSVSLIAAADPGIAEVTCTSSEMTQTVTVAMGVGSIVLTASPTSLPADGHSSSAIKAVVNNSAGIPVSTGTSVTFSTQLGTFSNGQQTITMGTIDSTGVVTVSLIAGTTSGLAEVVCSSGGLTQSVSVSIGTLPIASITLAANPGSIPADGASSSTITATVLDVSGTPLHEDSVPVTFTTDLGHFSNGSKIITVLTITGGDWGKVVVSLIAGTTSGVAHVVCESGKVTQSTNVTIGSSAEVASITLSANPTSLLADGVSSSTLTATLLDISGNLLIKDNVLVKFKTTLGNFSNGLQTITVATMGTFGVSGKVLVSLIAGTTSGIATVVCESGNVTQSTVVTIGTSGQVASITLSANPTSLPVGDSSSTITALLLDTSGDLIRLSNIPVTFTTTLGHFSNNLQTITVTSQSTTAVPGKVVVSLIAGTTSGIALIKCESGGVTQTTNVTIGSSAQVASITLSASPTTLPSDGISSSTLTALLKDITGNPITQSNIAVTFTTTQGLGHFSNGSNTITVTTANSVGSSGAVVVSLIAGTTSGTAVVTCASGGVTQATTITIGSVSTQVASITLTASPLAFPASDATLSSTITATLYTANGQPVSSGVVVSFATNMGFFSNKLQTVIGYTNSSGVALAYVYSGGTVGTAQINVSAGAGISRFVFVNFTGSSSTADIVLSLKCTGSSCDGSSITATLYDKYGQTVSSGEAVNFTTTIGHFANKLNTIVAYTNAAGIASVVIYSGGSIGTAQVSASSNGIARYIDVKFTGVGPPAYISLSTAHKWIPADGYSHTAITAVILDSAAQPVTAGTVVEFNTTSLGVFENGKTTYLTATQDAKGTLTVYLRSTSTIYTTGVAVITCSSGSITQSITVDIVRLEYETEPNNEMVQADGICFRNVFLGQLSSPYDEDWYTFTITGPSRIGINFITTAAPADAKCDSGTTTVGTWKVDIRDSDNNVLMSYHNVDCIFDNGTWETGVVPQGTYYVVVYCPRLGGTGDIYLSDPYYMRVFNDFYFPCIDRDQSVNSATLSQKDSAYRLHVPIVDTTSYLWTDFQYDPISATSLMFKLTNYGVLTNLEGYRACNLSTLSLVDGNYVLHIPLLIFDGVSYRADLIYVPTTDGLIWFMLSGVWAN